MLGFSTMVAAANIIDLQFQALLCLYIDYRVCTAPDAPALLVFTGLATLVYEGVAVAVRFINFHFVSAFSKVILALVR